MSGSSKKQLKLPVRALVDFSARKGDLFADVPVGPNAKEGILGHQKLQKSRDKSWQSEFTVKQTITRNQFNIVLTGRIDLVCQSNVPPIIEEVKTTYVELEAIPEEKQHLHKAQVEVYAYLFHLHLAETDPLINSDSQYQVQTTWFNLLENKESAINETLSAKQLAVRVLSYIDTYLEWYQQFQAHRKNVVLSASKLQFPFHQYRPGQHYFAKSVYQTIKDKNHLLVEAPTGSGKTMSTLFAGCKAIGEGVIKQIVYLTAKGSAQKTAIENLNILTSNHLALDFLVIQAKDKTCPCRSTDLSISQTCDNGTGQCSRTIGFFDRLGDARRDCLKQCHLDSAAIQAIAQKHHLCPFELSLQMVQWSSITICDFNYFLDPMVKLSAFDNNPSSRIVLIDEIHNLTDRARNMYSAVISVKQAQLVYRQIKHQASLKKKIKSYITQIKHLAELSHQMFEDSRTQIINANDRLLTEPPSGIKETLESLFELIGNASLSDGFAGGMNNNQIEGFHEWLKTLYRYYFISELYNDEHVTLVEKHVTSKGKATEVELKLLCLDAAAFLRKKYKSARAIIGFSATVSPFEYYQQMTGLEPQLKSLRLPPVFPIENQLTIRCDYIDTRWNQREQSIGALCKLLTLVTNHNPGKYLIFFPSYDYLMKCQEVFSKDNPLVKTISQTRNSNDDQRKEFLAGFFESSVDLLGFAILGGVYGEGVDFAGNSLNGVIIVGAGMPQPTSEQKLIESHLVSKGYNGFQYCYQFPGFTRVKQTAGRVIRSESDRGVVILVDPRFQRRDYQLLMPEQWQVKPCKNLTEVNSHLNGFWNSPKQ